MPASKKQKISLMKIISDTKLSEKEKFTQIEKLIKNFDNLDFIYKEDKDSPDEGQTPLTAAIYHGLEMETIILIANKSNITKKNKSGYTPLLVAASVGDLDAVEFFLKKGLKINDKIIETGSTPLMLAAENGQLNVVEYLLEHGAKLDEVNKEGKTALGCAEDKKIELNSTKITTKEESVSLTEEKKLNSAVIDLLTMKKFGISAKKPSSQEKIMTQEKTTSTFLHPEQIQQALQDLTQKHLQWNIVNSDSNTELYAFTCVINQNTIADLEKKFDNIQIATLQLAETAVEFLKSCSVYQVELKESESHVYTIKVVLKVIPEKNAKSTFNGMLAKFKKLNAKKSDSPVFIQDFESIDPKKEEQRARKESKEHAKQLEERLKARMEGKVRRHSGELPEFDSGKTSSSSSPKQPRTPENNNTSKTASPLFSLGLFASKTPSPDNTIAQTELMEAIEEHSLEKVMLALQKTDPNFIYKNATQDEDDDNETPLTTALINNCDDKIILALAKSDKGLRTKHGFSPVLAAAAAGNLMALKLFLNPFNINETTHTEATSLMLAAENGHVEVVIHLLENGADATKLNFFGQNAIDCIIESMEDPKNFDKADAYSKIINLLYKYMPEVKTTSETLKAGLLLETLLARIETLERMKKERMSIQHTSSTLTTTNFSDTHEQKIISLLVELADKISQYLSETQQQEEPTKTRKSSEKMMGKKDKFDDEVADKLKLQQELSKLAKLKVEESVRKYELKKDVGEHLTTYQPLKSGVDSLDFLKQASELNQAVKISYLEKCLDQTEQKLVVQFAEIGGIMRAMHAISMTQANVKKRFPEALDVIDRDKAYDARNGMMHNYLRIIAFNIDELESATTELLKKDPITALKNSKLEPIKFRHKLLDGSLSIPKLHETTKTMSIDQQKQKADEVCQFIRDRFINLIKFEEIVKKLLLSDADQSDQLYRECGILHQAINTCMCYLGQALKDLHKLDEHRYTKIFNQLKDFDPKFVREIPALFWTDGSKQITIQNGTFFEKIKGDVGHYFKDKSENFEDLSMYKLFCPSDPIELRSMVSLSAEFFSANKAFFDSFAPVKVNDTSNSKMEKTDQNDDNDNSSSLHF